MFPFDPPENIRKPLVFWYFQWVKRKHWEEKGWKTFPDFKWTMLSFKSTWYFFWWMFVNPQLVTSFIYLFFYFSHAILISLRKSFFLKKQKDGLQFYQNLFSGWIKHLKKKKKKKKDFCCWIYWLNILGEIYRNLLLGRFSI